MPEGAFAGRVAILDTYGFKPTRGIICRYMFSGSGSGLLTVVEKSLVKIAYLYPPLRLNRGGGYAGISDVTSSLSPIAHIFLSVR